MPARSCESAAGGEQPRAEQRAIALGLAHGESGVAIGTDAANSGDAEVQVCVKVLFNPLAGVIRGPKSGPSARAQVHVQIDQSRGEEFSRAVDLVGLGWD